MSDAKIALCLYILGSLCFLAGSTFSFWRSP